MGLFLAATAAAATPREVPAGYRDLHDGLERKLIQVESEIDAQWDGKNPGVVFSAELLTANANRGQLMLQPRSLEGVRTEMDRLREMGVQGLVLSVNFPILDPEFHRFIRSDFDAYLRFYKSVAQEARSRGQKVVADIGSGIFPGVYSQGSGLRADGYYKHLKTLDAYAESRVRMAKVVARELEPDFISLGNEPDTEAALTGLPLDDPERYAAIIERQARELNAEASAARLGAGIGNWQRAAEDWVDRLARVEGLDFIDLHVYPINMLDGSKPDLLRRFLALSDRARAAGKRVAVSECWLMKSRDSEIGRIDSTRNSTFFARDIDDFWQPLDIRFLKIMVKVAQWKDFEFLSPFWTRLFYDGYLPADPKASDRAARAQASRIQASNRRAGAALYERRFSETGRAYAELIGGRLPDPAPRSPQGQSAAIRDFQESCGSDVQEFCARTKPGGGRVVKCLGRNWKDLTAACQAYLKKVSQP